MKDKRPQEQRHVIARTLMEIGLPAIGFVLPTGFAIRDLPASLITGLAISCMIFVLYRLDRTLLHPHLERLSRDWVHLGLEMTFSLLEHVLGALLVLLVCSRVFGFAIEASTGWIALAGMVIAFPIVHGTEMALRFFRQLQEKELQEEQLRTLATAAELKALKAQINPHFLFNTLNTIAQLIHTDSTQAEAMVERLAEMLRYVLNGSALRQVPLEEEIIFLDSYLEIERARFGKRLYVNCQVAPEARERLVPSLLLQPLVENAVRHGHGTDGRINLTIRAETYADDLVITIADQGPGIPARHKIGEGPGHGLHNVDQRLRKTYGEKYGLTIAAGEPRGTIVTIKIPIGDKA